IFASSASIFAFGMTLPRIAVSGHSVTQSMHPTQLDEMNSGISGAMNEKSRGAPLPAGTTDRAVSRSASSSMSPTPFSYSGSTRSKKFFALTTSSAFRGKTAGVIGIAPPQFRATIEDMELKISISDQTEARLREDAAAAGVSMEAY